MRIAFTVVLSSLLVAIADMGTGGKVEAAPNPGNSAVEQAQLWVASVDKPAHVLSTDTRPLWKSAEESSSSI
ncbi:MAG: hypothetical protein B9S33_22205 [Pedosphaera sp. Tous-C6FEB]|nr:MAG: hypothetical protein B9S33_22205 [Pedosphaera sp. Tous-C6FEB]